MRGKGRSRTRAVRRRCGAEGKKATARQSPVRRTDAAHPLRTSGAKAEIVVYVHGILNKPPPSVLKCQWDTALFGVDMGDRTRMAYWVNRAYYPTPLDETCAEGDRIVARPEEQALVRTLGLSPTDTDEDWLERHLDEIGAGRRERRRLKRIGHRLLVRSHDGTRGPRARGYGARVLPIPAPLRRWITRVLTGAFLRDVNDFLFSADRREAMEAALRERLRAGGGPFVVVGHSQGSMIAYDVLRQMSPEECHVALFVTLGSPLGLDEVQDVVRGWTGARGRLPIPRCVDRWINGADPWDLVAADPTLADDFDPEGKIRDLPDIVNPDRRNNPHSASGYLHIRQVRDAVVDVVGTHFAQPVRSFIIARDLVRSIENEGEVRHPVLIQLAGKDGAGQRPDLVHIRDEVLASLRRIVGRNYEEEA